MELRKAAAMFTALIMALSIFTVPGFAAQEPLEQIEQIEYTENSPDIVQEQDTKLTQENRENESPSSGEVIAADSADEQSVASRAGGLAPFPFGLTIEETGSGTAQVTRYKGSDTSVVIPSTYNGKPVTSIGERAFANCGILTSVTIPSSVTSIGSYAFFSCSSLTSITIPNGVSSIGERAFYLCNSLTSITIPDGVTSIEYYTFGDCRSLSSITIPDSVTSIEQSAFSSCSSLTSITIPDSVTSIGSYAFSSCSSLTSITIPDGVTSIEYATFRDCRSLSSITIPNGVTSIGHVAFEGCSSLTSITLPDGVTSIGGRAFLDCSSLTSIAIPAGVTSIGPGAFSGCSSLTSITIPDGVSSIGEDVFWGCISLTSVTIPDTVTSIGGRAFRDCSSLTSITIPDSVTRIGGEAFSRCWSLEDVFYTGSEAQWENVSGRANVPESAVIHYNSRGPVSTPPDELDEVRIAQTKLERMAQSYRGGQGSFKLSDLTKAIARLNQQYVKTGSAPGSYGHEWGSAFFSEPSTNFNKDLARAAAELSDRSWEGEDAIKKLYDEWGIQDCEPYGYTNAPGIAGFQVTHKGNAFAIGHKTLSIDGVPTTVLVVTARGSKTLGEFIGSGAKGRKEDPPSVGRPDLKVWENVNDFEKDLWNGLQDYLTNHSDISRMKMKILITGHSLGGAAANLLGAHITHAGLPGDNAPLPKRNIYVYTFNAITVLCTEKNITAGFENIHNVYNVKDCFSPGSPAPILKDSGISSPGAKFGHTHVYEFDNGIIETHSNYRDALDLGMVEETCVKDHGNDLW